jgi:light-independent protochlorophyllide reductase subunit B
MFRDDFEFHDGAAASHLGHVSSRAEPATVSAAATEHESVFVAAAGVTETAGAGTGAIEVSSTWAPDAQKELNKIPFFVRGKARRNTERYAIERGVQLITVETLYDAKAHFSR